jgi:hypothetical protein
VKAKNPRARKGSGRSRGRPKGSLRVGANVAKAFELTPFDRAMVDGLGQPGGAQQLHGMQAESRYRAHRAQGLDHDAANEAAALELGISSRKVDKRRGFIAAASDREISTTYRFLRGAMRQDPRKALDNPYLTVKARAKFSTNATPTMSIDEALVECVRRCGYGTGKPDHDGRINGLEPVLKALRRQGVAEVVRTSLKVKRQRLRR